MRDRTQTVVTTAETMWRTSMEVDAEERMGTAVPAELRPKSVASSWTVGCPQASVSSIQCTVTHPSFTHELVDARVVQHKVERVARRRRGALRPQGVVNIPVGECARG
jgi:invasion protein IalB